MLDQSRVIDGFTSLEGGMDGGSATNLLPRSKVAMLMNATVRSGYVNNRPGWANLPLTFPDPTTQTAFTTGVFQGAGWYYPDDGDPYLFASLSGHVFRLMVRGQPGQAGIVVEDLTPSGDANDSTLPFVWMCQADKFMVMQDGVDTPFVYDGAVLRRSTCALPNPPNPGNLPPYSPQLSGNKEVPVGTAMAYGYGRLWLVRGKNVEAGDILNAAVVNSAILFTEVIQFNDSFSVPVTSGDITAIIFGANIDTSIGQGPLQLHTESGQVITLNVTVDRTSWTTTSIQAIGLMGGASTGQNAIVNVNNDSWFRSHDGIRSFVIARREFSTWGNTPQSREVNNILNYDTTSALTTVSAVWFSNRLLVTTGAATSPSLNQSPLSNTYFQGLAVLDFDLLSTLNRYTGTVYSPDPQPAWDGIWSGINISQITKAFFGSTERCMIFAFDPVSGNQVWELSQSDPFDNGNCPILSWFETGSYNFNQLASLKKLIGADLWLDQLQGTVGFSSWWAADQMAFWQPWESWEESDGNPCGTTVQLNQFMSCQTPVTSPPQYRSRVRLQEPGLDSDNPQTIYPANYGYDFRIRFAWSGRVRIKGIRIAGYIQEDETTNTPLATENNK